MANIAGRIVGFGSRLDNAGDVAKNSGRITGVGSRLDNAGDVTKNSGRIIGVGSRLENFQTACDVIGMTEIPFVSQGADLISGGISLATGDYVGAALSVGSLLPGIGQVTGAAKMARRTTKIAPKLLEVTAKGAKKVDAAADAKLLKYNNVKASEKVIDDMSATGKKVDAPKKNISKKSEIDAKTTKKENVKEREVVEKDPSDGSKLDVHEYTYPWEGNRANPNEFTDPYPKNIAKDRDLGPFEHLKKDVADKKVSQNLQSKNSGLIKQNKYWGTNIGSNSGISKINPYPKPNFGL